MPKKAFNLEFLLEERRIDEKQCQCRGCVIKRERKEANRPWKKTKKLIQIAVLIGKPSFHSEAVRYSALVAI